MSRRAALVTGASRGIGALIAGRLAAEGWDLTLSARSEGPLEDLAEALRTEHGVSVGTVTADMAQEHDVLRLATAQIDGPGRLDALVLNAGMGSIGPLADFPARRLDKLYTVNVRSGYLLIQTLLPLLRATSGESDAARVIAVSSLTGVAGEPLNSAYGATKAALTSLCETLNTEESLGGVTGTAVCPGYVATDMTAPLTGQVAHEAMIDPTDVAEVVVGVTRLSRSVVIPSIPMVRPGTHLWQA
ncbi:MULTISPECIES: SDR family NAD(P)-dependent oxidoreductase [unclassified Pseudonocardia]|uniref:SDR family NAD(P)-dependent oxidoreductase n=1 Tax=unclassified Pseudonocardia TaxID=2619320 RepID=UPI0001FFDE15|nr:SDR family NAD(P)-dependent oxidoreductase [Pseudonocardia sp. Ae707_Ps1]OLM08913.1 putative short chain dehydrogenase [Pseudonocardia sp. Ae707_Ps1]